MSLFPKRKKTGKESGTPPGSLENSSSSEASGNHKPVGVQKKASSGINLKDFKDIFDTISDGLVYTTLTGRVVFVNHALTEIFGLKREDIENKNIFELAGKLLDARNLSRAMPFLEQIIKGKNPGPFIVEYMDKILEVNSRFSLISRRLIGTIRDITVDIQSRLAIEESESRLKRAEMVAGAGNWELNLNTRVMFGSDGALKIYGLRDNYLGYEQINNIPLPEYRKMLDEALHDLITGAKPYNVEFKIRNQETGEIIDIFSVAEYDREKNVVFGIIQDITSRKRIESELKERNKALNKLLDITLNLHESVDKKEVLNNIISGALDILDLDTGALYTLNDERLRLEATLPPLPDDFPEIFRMAHLKNHPHIRKAVDTENPVVAEDLLSEKLTEEEKEIIKIRNLVSVIYVPLISARSIKGVLILGTTGKKKSFSPLEISLCQTLSNFASLAIENSILFNNILIERNKAKESDRLKTAFLHNISHEIRTPLNAIIGFSSMLEDPGITEKEKKDYLEIIRQSNNKLLSIIDDILNISQIETGQAKLNESITDINVLLTEAYNQFGIEARRKNINFILENRLSGHDNKIIADEKKLKQIITNLLSNAFKFTDYGSVKLACEKNDNHLLFTVSDTGIGIHPEHLNKIFERFYQVDVSATRIYGGTGLGLSIAQAWAKMLNGEITVISEPGKGSQFCFKMELNNNILSEPEKPQTEKPAEPAFRKSDRGVKVIVAEDDETNFQYIESLLKPYGFKILHVRNGSEACRVYSENTDVRLILMDVKMPVMDGLTAAREILKMNPSLPIIAQTAYAFPEDRERALESGCADYIAKPFNRDKLFEVIRKYLILI